LQKYISLQKISSKRNQNPLSYYTLYSESKHYIVALVGKAKEIPMPRFTKEASEDTREKTQKKRKTQHFQNPLEEALWKNFQGFFQDSYQSSSSITTYLRRHCCPCSACNTISHNCTEQNITGEVNATSDS
jgi:hypothetical protein